VCIDEDAEGIASAAATTSGAGAAIGALPPAPPGLEQKAWAG